MPLAASTREVVPQVHAEVLVLLTDAEVFKAL
jgi:hypothetical protein